jgi:hypothetical protein
MVKRPVSIAIIGGLFIGLGTFVMLANLFWLARGQGVGAEEYRDLAWVFGTELLAVVAGVFLLRGRNWARWLVVAWMVFHVVLSAVHPGHALVVHGVLTAVVIYFLFRAPASEYFRGGTVRE